MQVNPSTLVTKTMALSVEERRKIPGAYQKTLSIFAKHVPEIGLEPLDIRFTAQKIENDTKALMDAAEKLQKAEKHEKLHKILSITLLALTVSLVAASILLTVFVNPVLFPLFLTIFIPVIAASFLTLFCTKDPNTFPIPFGAEINYIYNAFRRPNPKPPTAAEYQAHIDTNTQKLEKDLERLQLIRLNQDTIRKGIKQELKGFNLADYSNKDDVKRIESLRYALKTLDDLMTSCEKIQ